MGVFIINDNNRVDKFGRLLGRVMYSGIDIGDSLLRVGLATTFNARNEGKLPNLDKVFSLKQWL